MTALHRTQRGPFTASDAAGAAGIARDDASQKLQQLARGGWLTRIQRGLYATVPLEAEDAQHWAADPWAIAYAALAPGYVGGWTALHRWDLTDQLFSVTVFITARPLRKRKRSIGGADFLLSHRAEESLFGTRGEWRDGLRVEISDRERTLVDCLDDPSLGGGIRHTADALAEYARANPDWEGMIDYGDRLGNATVFKRLGYLAENLDLVEDAVLEACRSRVSKGIGRLDPSLPEEGSIRTRWGLRINTRITG